MRKIKFRVWDKDFKKMHVCGSDIHDSLEISSKNSVFYYNLQNGEGSLDEDSTYVLMQYTGLQDRNGKEIYEGDIIKISGHTEFKSIVKWENYCWKCGEKSLYNISTINWANIEVIGNMYENKELLEGNKDE